ncbi:uncharacterized protein LOC107489597 [Arachis duranensis]|uniref:Uncharacterized protein LOC107489597 n=1 Tax=Arachis duranensis TaxID=130453 RepID=A0A6P4DER6_ARADU|nr:uncharacterized protein LOC107489597 [Arachis duranensis]
MNHRKTCDSSHLISSSDPPPPSSKMQDSIGIPACFSSSPLKGGGDEGGGGGGAVTRSGQSVYMSVYRTKIADNCRKITITWCKNLLLHGLSVSVEGLKGDTQYTCKVELKPWYFWKKQGSKLFVVDDAYDKPLHLFWDLKTAKFNGETEPSSEYYVAVVWDDDVVLLLGDLKKEAYRRTGCRPSLIDPILVAKKEHIFGKKKLSTRAKFHEKGRWHEISIECKGRTANDGGDSVLHHQPEMEIRIDGHLVIHVKHLQWKFRGNESIHLSKMRVEVYWDVHDWLFSPGLKHALFIFKPAFSSSSVSMSSSSTPLSSSSSSSSPPLTRTSSVEGFSVGGSSEFCLFLYAWKVIE